MNDSIFNADMGRIDHNVMSMTRRQSLPFIPGRIKGGVFHPTLECTLSHQRRLRPVRMDMQSFACDIQMPVNGTVEGRLRKSAGQHTLRAAGMNQIRLRAAGAATATATVKCIYQWFK